jgi:antitoxin HicB
MSRTVDEYMQLPYRVILTYDRDQDGNEGWVAEVAELPGCLSQGATPQEAAAKIRNAMLGWISVALEDGHTIPEPGGEGYSGKFVIRVPSSLHRDLARAAREEGVSLNQFTSGVLASAVSWRLPHPVAGSGSTRAKARRSKATGGRGSARA